VVGLGLGKALETIESHFGHISNHVGTGLFLRQGKEVFGKSETLRPEISSFLKNKN
jgi:hypothetical protein